MYMCWVTWLIVKKMNITYFVYISAGRAIVLIHCPASRIDKTHRQQWMWIRTQSCDSRCRIQSLASLISWDSFRDTTAAILASSATKWTRTCSFWHSEGPCGRSVYERQGTLNTRWFLWLANSPTALNVHWGKHGLMVSRLDSLRRGRCGDKASSGRVHPTSQCWKDISQVTYSKNTTYWFLLSNFMTFWWFGHFYTT